MRKILLMLLGMLPAFLIFGKTGDEFTYTYEGQTLTYTVLDEDAKTVTTKPATGEPAYGYIEEAGNYIGSGQLIIPEIAKDGDTEYTVTELGWAAFARSNMTSVVLPNSITSIAEYAFFDCSALTSVIIPISVKEINSYAFYLCKNLISVTIPESITKIGSNAFAGCSSLTSVNIPSSVTEISDLVFDGCSSLNSINVDENNKNYASIDGILFNKDLSILIYYPIARAEIAYIIPSSVTKIYKSAFKYCSTLTTITIPDSVIEIGNYAFFDCRNLTSLNIPDSVIEIGDSAFERCSSLSSVTIGNSVTSIGQSCFADCISLISVTIPNSVTIIPLWMFRNCSSLTSVTIPDSVTIIGIAAFDNCSSLTSVTIPDSVTKIDWEAFMNCYRLTSITIPDSTTYIGNNAFESCWNLEEVILPLNLESLGSNAFRNCQAIKNVVVRGATPVETTEDVFDDTVYENATLYVPSGCIDAYRAVCPWQNFSHITDEEYLELDTIVANGNSGIDLSKPYEVYDFSGKRVSRNVYNLSSGLYIIRQGNTTYKISVK